MARRVWIAAATVAVAVAAMAVHGGAGRLLPVGDRPHAAAAAFAPPLPTAPTALVMPADHAARVERVHARCVSDMVRQVCRVMTGPAVQSLPADAVVFVAGLGAVQAVVYNELRASGDGMCAAVSARCRAEWHGAACKTARALYASP